MARFKPYNYDQTELLAISFKEQILPGTFEYTLNHLVERELDTSIFHSRYQNDETGRPAYDPALLLKIVLLAYSRGITSSRKIEELCRENIIFMALSANTQPHFTTIADFISRSSEEISELFLQVLMICDEQGLIGREMFAIDGCKLPSNASKEWSGTHADLRKKQKKLDKAVRNILRKHRETDLMDKDEAWIEREKKQVEKLQAASAKIKAFLKTSVDKPGKDGRMIQSNITDNESAKMKCSHGVIQGYTAVAAVDSKCQVIVAAEVYGQSNEHGLLEPMIEAAHENLGSEQAEREEIKILADAGYHNKNALNYLEENKLDGYIADPGFRSRDPRFKDYKAHDKYKKTKKAEQAPEPNKFTRSDFKVDLKKEICICPAGNEMKMNARHFQTQSNELMNFRAKPSDCQNCAFRSQCLDNPEQISPRSYSINKGVVKTPENALVQRMKEKIDSALGRAIYSLRLGTVEPVFGHLTSNIGLKRFSLRGKAKVNAQWHWMAVLHNALKLHRYGALK